MTPVVAPLVLAVDRILLHLSCDRLCLTTLLTGLPVMLVTTTGARTGCLREHPLTALRESDRFALVASNFGRSRYPGWYYNLRAHPDAQIRLAGRQQPVRARPASSEERARFWAIAVHHYPGYALYERRAAPRPVPVFVLEPSEDPVAR